MFKLVFGADLTLTCFFSWVTREQSSASYTMRRSLCCGVFALAFIARSSAFHVVPRLVGWRGLPQQQQEHQQQQRRRIIQPPHVEKRTSRRSRSSLRLSTTVAPPPPNQVRHFHLKALWIFRQNVFPRPSRLQYQGHYFSGKKHFVPSNINEPRQRGGRVGCQGRFRLEAGVAASGG